ncbi:hypothetical protein LWF15_32865 [Kineosporia rhizophila]|uniref:hypothetical protein n=1 Tax=Kineosporia rhizophila TaxID=84633 RepID=UPI001E4D07AD|nr:hypothetical protein [Kineosporia rhizophila]MCE0540298.1 hypothetical protein [Kineosporia rhizophila]
MNRLGHQAAAQATWLSICSYEQLYGDWHLGWQHVVAGAVVASSMCADDWSPDADQGGVMAKIIPGGHRGPTHMPELVFAVLYGLSLVLTPDLDWFLMAAAAAWGSHLAADFLFGGIPFALATLTGNSRRIGAGFKTGGKFEKVLTGTLTALSLPLAYIAVGGNIPFQYPGA